ncbi:MAG: hypothetical protein IPM95_12610 [Sphingobacteriales bacterium]|jgi:hypothetical protein|nr:hypothetical protein [Sphingobacteriales bacterium]
MKKTTYILLFWGVVQSGFGQNSFAVWQGFSNYWTYNHRVNRLGDYINQISYPKNQQATLVHTAATGLGKDSVYFSSYYASVQSSEIIHFAGKSVFTLKGEEGTVKTIRKKIILHPDSSLQQKEVYLALLNGFDLISLGDADKLQTLSVSIDNPAYDKPKNELSFLLQVVFQADCSSPECSLLNQGVDYKLSVYYLIIGGMQKDVSSKELDYERKVQWDTKTETPKVPLEKSISISPGFENGFFAYKRFCLQVNKERHYLGYENAINRSGINTINQTAFCNMQLHYSNWSPHMRKSPASGGQAFFAFSQAGEAVIKGTLLMVQFNGTVSQYQQDSTLFWEGKNHSPDSDAAMKSKTILLK